jgi:uncharacterized membrane protein
VQIPKGTGVEFVDGSFSIPPAEVIPGADFDTLIFDLTLTSTDRPESITWQSTVSGLQPGQSRSVTLGSTIDFAYQGTTGQITLPPTSVAAEQVLSLDPPSRTVRPGESATYTVTIANPAQASVTYDLAVLGVPGEWVGFDSQVTIAAGGSVDLALVLTSPPFTPPSEAGFVVVATTGGVSGQVEGTLVLTGEPVLPEVDPQAHGVVLVVDPLQQTAGQGTAARYKARVTNTGSATDTFRLTADVVPPGLTISFDTDTVTIPPGASNFREVEVTVVVAPGTAPLPYAFSILAASATEEGASDAAVAIVNVVSSGVAVDLVPDVGDPGSTFELRVTNLGSQPDTFALSVAAPAALVAALQSTMVTLMPGESRMVPIEVDEIDFAFPGTLDLVGVATSTTSPDVADADMSDIMIRGAMGVDARFDPDTFELPAPGDTSFLLLVDNLGNLEDVYKATIISTTGPLTATLRDLDGTPAQSVQFRLPGLTAGAILVNATLTDFGTGTVTVEVRSLTDESIVDQATATVFAAGSVDFDFGDAPTAVQSGFAVSYPTLLADNGPRHTIVEFGPQFGFFDADAPDAESDGQPTPLARGDESSGRADENPSMFTRLTQPLTAGQQAAFSIAYRSLESDAFINLWIDWNRDGDWSDAGEQVLSDLAAPATVGGAILLSNRVNVPADAPGGVTYARARISSLAGLGVTGAAPDGEVEDFTVTVVRPAGFGSISGLSYADVNNNGSFDAGERPLLGTQILLLGAGDRVLAQTFSNQAGVFRFDGLTAGSYIIRKVQPGLFIDGKDTPGTLGDHDALADQFTIALPEGGIASNYLFAERGLLPWYIGKSQYLASTPEFTWDGLDLAVTDLWYPFEPQALELDVVLDFASENGGATVELFDERMQPVPASTGAPAGNWQVTPGQTHYLRLSGTNRDVDVALSMDNGDGDSKDGDFNGNGQVEQGDLDWVLLNWGLGEDGGDARSVGPGGNVGQAALDAVLLNWGR